MTQSAELTIGVAMPARDAARYVAAALRSALDQGVAPDQLVVVNDGSTDATAAIAAAVDARVRVVSQPSRGPAAARNRALAELATDLVAFLDADDMWPAGSLAARRQALLDDPAAEICFGRVVQFVSPDLSPADRRRLHVDEQPRAAWASSAMLARREVFERYGRLPEHRRAGDFLEWLLAARAAGARIVTIDDVVLHRRVHLDNLTRRERDQDVNYLAIVRADLARRRAGGT